MTEASVIAFQRQFALTPDGIIGRITWDKIVERYFIAEGGAPVSPVYPGTPFIAGSRGDNVRRIQQRLNEVRSRYPSVPAISVDGIFGPLTEAAVVAFQRAAGLVPDGIVGHGKHL